MLVRILTEPANSLLKQFEQQFEWENVSLKFSQEALRAVAQRAMDEQTGARGLKSILVSVPSHSTIQIVHDSHQSQRFNGYCFIHRMIFY